MSRLESIPRTQFHPAIASAEDLSSGTGNSASDRRVPQVSRLLLLCFSWYSRGYLRRHFHSLRVSLGGLPPERIDLPLVIYSNHASWWDALVCLVLKEELFPGRNAFAPIDDTMLARYRFFQKLGFFGVNQGSCRGGIQFLRTAETILRSPQNILALTPQGRFVDVRERPVRFAPGLGHLAARIPSALFVPFAAEYVFWEERLPEILVRFGEPTLVQDPHRSRLDATGWTKLFEENLTATQAALAIAAQGRRPADFLVMMRGGAGQGGVYDLWRWIKSKWTGEDFRKEHGSK